MKSEKRLMSFLKKTSLLITGLVFVLFDIATAQVTEEWLARYNGPGNYIDRARAIAVDANGNIYVTGASYDSDTGHDYATIKYDATGNQTWVARYNGPGNYDYATAIGADTSGNVYVTGYSWTSYTSDDFATIKYDTNGNELWVARYNGTTSAYADGANAMAVDANGNVYVTGYSWSMETSSDYATIKYDANGNQLWVARYNGPGNAYDYVNDIAVDASGNVYVTGYSLGSGTSYDYATVKYDANGNQLWVAQYNGPGNAYDEASAIAVDASGNIYVTGYSLGSGTSYDYATVKYDANGSQLWVGRYNGIGNSDDEAGAITVDTSGNVHVTGWSVGLSTDRDYATVKYDANGDQLWAARYNGPGNTYDGASAIAIDANSNVYVTGYSVDPSTARDYATIKYDASGNQIWMFQYNGPGNSDDEASAIAVDTSGNVYVTGWSDGSGTSYDYCTIKYSEVPQIITVAIDIKPGSYPNSVNLGSGGTVPVAIFSFSTFDATTVDPLTITLASAPVQLRGRGIPMTGFQDVNEDGLLDLMVHVETEALQLSETDEQALLQGQTFGGIPIQGSDSVRIVP